MINIMFVCHGNICRSPMAEFITKKIVADLGLSYDYNIVSRALSPEEYGSPIYPPAARELNRHDVPYERRKATLISRDEYEKFDVIAIMDDRNSRNIKRVLPEDKDGKIAKLLSFAGDAGDVFDPWYSGDFKAAYEDILKGCIGLLCKIDDRITREKIFAHSLHL